MEQGPPVTNSERPDTTANVPAAQESFWVPENSGSTYHQRFGNQEVLITDKRRINLAEAGADFRGQLTPKSPEAPRVQLAQIGDQEILVTDKRGIRPQEVEATFVDSMLENGYGEKTTVEVDTPQPEAAVERQDEPAAPKRIPTPADIHHNPRTQPSKRTESARSSVDPESTKEQEETGYEAAIKADGSLGRLKELAVGYGLAKALEARGYQDTDVDNLSGAYANKLANLQQRGIASDVLSYIDQRYVKEPTDEEINARIKELKKHEKQYQKKPAVQSDGIDTNDPLIEGEVVVEPPKEEELIDVEPEEATTAEEIPEERLTWRQHLRNVRAFVRDLATPKNRLSKILDPDIIAGKYNDQESAIHDGVDKNAPEAEQKEQVEKNNIKRELGYVSRYLRRGIGSWADKLGYGLAFKAYKWNGSEDDLGSEEGKK